MSWDGVNNTSSSCLAAVIHGMETLPAALAEALHEGRWLAGRNEWQQPVGFFSLGDSVRNDFFNQTKLFPRQ